MRHLLPHLIPSHSVHGRGVARRLVRCCGGPGLPELSSAKTVETLLAGPISTITAKPATTAPQRTEEAVPRARWQAQELTKQQQRQADRDAGDYDHLRRSQQHGRDRDTPGLDR